MRKSAGALANLLRGLDAKVLPDRIFTRPFAVPTDADRVADCVRIAGANLNRDFVPAEMKELLSTRRLRREVELHRCRFGPPSSDLGLVLGGQVDVQEVDVALGSRMHGAHGPRRARS